MTLISIFNELCVLVAYMASIALAYFDSKKKYDNIK